MQWTMGLDALTTDHRRKAPVEGPLSPARMPSIESEETRLIEQARKGDVDAFEQLYRSYVGRIYSLTLRMVADSDRADDLVQEIFLRCWQRLDSFKGQSRFYSWLFRLATNVAIDRLRWEHRRSKWESLEHDFDSTPSTQPAPSHETGIALEEAIASLPDGARTVFVLHDVEGFKHEEIAEMTGIASGTSKAQLHRARALLRERLQQ